VDLDAPEAVAAAPYFLPDTDRVHGREGKPSSHYWYLPDGPRTTTKFQDLDGTMLVEVRSTGGQTMAPPSMHPTAKERVRWEKDGEPARVKPETLLRSVGEVAAAAILARHWPEEGSRQDFALALAGGLLDAGWEQEDVETFLVAVSVAAGDEEGDKRATAAAYTAKAKEAGKHTTGWTRLASLLGVKGPEVVKRVKEWLGGGPGQRTPAAQRPDRPGYTSTLTARELVELKIPEPKWAVPGLLSEGLNLFAVKPKVGKSWLALAASLVIATGGKVLGRDVHQGDVLYIGLEDNVRRMQKRVGKLLAGKTAPDRLHVRLAWPRQDEGGLEALGDWLDAHPEARLVVIDTWKKFRQAKVRGRDGYDEDYEAAAQVQELALEYGVAILVLHHRRKMEEGDYVDSVSGTTGLTGAADTILVLKRDRGKCDAVLFATGRDIEEEVELGLGWDKGTATWSVLGNAEECRRSPERQAVLDLLAQEARPLGPKEAATLLGKSRVAVRKLIRDMHQDGELVKYGRGKYGPPQPGANKASA
jgi:hypothetical protein